jgi:diguanylate cyclase (GGDEF)-like protein
MKRLSLVIVTAILFPGDIAAQSETIAELHQKIATLERAVEGHRYRELRNGVLAGALGLGLTAFGLYRRRVDTARLEARLGTTDALTGATNRAHVTRTIGGDCRLVAEQHRQAQAAGVRPPADGDLLFLMIDIDSFKAINERHGHAAGDRLLAQIADVIRSTCRTSDTVARWNGEEFLVMLRHTNRETAPISAERIRMAVEQRVIDLGEGRTAGCTCSIGFAPFPLAPAQPDAASWEQVVALADEALRRAKQAGGNTWVGADLSPKAEPGHAPGRLLDVGPDGLEFIGTGGS